MNDKKLNNILKEYRETCYLISDARHRYKNTDTQVELLARQNVETKKQLQSLLKQAELRGAVKELNNLRPSFVKTGYAGTHYVYQISFDIDKQISKLEAEMGEK